MLRLLFLLVTLFVISHSFPSIQKRGSSEFDLLFEVEPLRHDIYNLHNDIRGGSRVLMTRLLSTIPTIHSPEGQRLLMEDAINMLHGDVAEEIVDTMMKSGWRPLEEHILLAMKKPSALVFNVFLQHGIPLDSRLIIHQLKSLVQHALASKKKKLDDTHVFELVKFIVFRGAPVPGAENEVLTFLLKDGQLPEQEKNEYLEHQILPYIPEDKMKAGLLLAVEMNAYTIAAKMMRKGWARTFTKKDFQSIRASGNSELIDLCP